MTDSVAAAKGDFVLAVDPYGYQPGIASRITGLADGELGNEPAYVFHTDYLELGRGHMRARIRFAGLRAKLGALQVRVHMLTAGEGSRLVLVNSERITLARLIQLNGQLAMDFEAFSGCRYAIYGSILGNTDAAADGLGIEIEGTQENVEAGFHTEARNTAFGRTDARAARAMVSTEPPSLRSPVSQIATAQQLASPEARRWFGELGISDPATLDHWSMAYVLQCLHSYGMLAPGARGLGLGPGSEVVAEVLRRSGCAITLPETEAPEGRTADQAFLPALGTELVNFDFLWIWDPGGEMSDAQAWVKGAQRALTALLPGGVAIFTFGFDPTLPSRRTVPAGPAARIARPEIEQLALILVSRDHQVAQAKILKSGRPLLAADDPRHSAHGMIVRRALLPE